jgi:predicted dithiol-disulfide oxidoreductase (DUF899 family)
MAKNSRKKKPARKKPVHRAKSKARKKPAPKKAARKKARKGAITSSVRFAGETPAYRRARDKLLKSEIELRRLTEAVATQRRKLPQGGELIKDYMFEEADLTGNAKSVRFSELFTPGKDTLVVYNFMYGPAMEQACPSCTSILDALDGNAQAITQRVNLAVVAKSPLARIRSHARDRGWYKLRLLSSDGNSYNRDYHGETPQGSQRPMMNVFVKKGDTIRHFWGSELAYTVSEKGQDPRHVDFMWPLWNVFDTTPIGRGNDWRPKLRY